MGEVVKDVSEYSAVHVDGNEFIKDGVDSRWVEISWKGLAGQEGRYRMVVDPDNGDILFVDEEDDVRQVIDYRNLAVLIRRSERIQHELWQKKVGLA